MELAIYILSGIVVIQMIGAFIAIRVIRSKEKEAMKWKSSYEKARREAGEFEDKMTNLFDEAKNAGLFLLGKHKRAKCDHIPQELKRGVVNVMEEKDNLQKKNENILEQMAQEDDEHKEELRRWRRVTSKQIQRCKRCGRLHKAKEQILEGAMPGDTLCGGDKCNTYG